MGYTFECRVFECFDCALIKYQKNIAVTDALQTNVEVICIIRLVQDYIINSIWTQQKRNLNKNTMLRHLHSLLTMPYFVNVRSYTMFNDMSSGDLFSYKRLSYVFHSLADFYISYMMRVSPLHVCVILFYFQVLQLSYFSGRHLATVVYSQTCFLECLIKV